MDVLDHARQAPQDHPVAPAGLQRGQVQHRRRSVAHSQMQRKNRRGEAEPHAAVFDAGLIAQIPRESAERISPVGREVSILALHSCSVMCFKEKQFFY